MAKNWSAYEAAKALYGNNKEDIIDIGSRFPLFTRTVSMVNDEYLLDILKAIPKVTARVVESGLKELEEVEEEETEVQEEKEAKKETTKKSKKVEKEEEPEEEEDLEEDYENMTAKALYKLCCDRGISSQCKKRDKKSLIAVLRENENGKAKEEDEDNWDDETEEDSDPYVGKSAKELYKMCTDRGIKTKPKQNADVYAKLLKKADEAEEEEDSEDDDDDWEI